MKVGIGLPNTIPGCPGNLILDWAKRAEERGFSTLATLDRIAYPNYEALVTLAAAGAVTRRIGLLTDVLLGPTRNPVLLAKEAASVDQLSGGRLTLGLGVGSREDDFTASGQDFKNRGKRWDEALELMHKAWQGEPVAGSSHRSTPAPSRGGKVPILIGGTADASIERAVKWGIGWTAGGAPVDRASAFAEKVRQAWKEAGREDEPQLAALNYFALGNKADEGALNYLSDYYGDWGSRIAQGATKSAEQARQVVKGFSDVGFTELIFFPTIPELSQVDMLADAVEL